MAMYITMTAAEAQAVRGKTSPMTAIEPVELKDGSFLLNDDVLTDPAHETKVRSITGFQRKALKDIESLLKVESVVKL